MFCNNTNLKYNQKSTLPKEFTWINSSRPINSTWLNHKRHVINQNVNLYYTELLPWNYRNNRVTRWRLRSVHLTARVTGTAGLTAAWSTGAGRRGLRRSLWYSSPGRMPQRTDGNGLDNGTSRPLTSAPCLSATVRPTRTLDLRPVDSKQVDSDPTQSPINSTG